MMLAFVAPLCLLLLSLLHEATVLVATPREVIMQDGDAHAFTVALRDILSVQKTLGIAPLRLRRTPSYI